MIRRSDNELSDTYETTDCEVSGFFLLEGNVYEASGGAGPRGFG